MSEHEPLDKEYVNSLTRLALRREVRKRFSLSNTEVSALQTPELREMLLTGGEDEEKAPPKKRGGKGRAAKPEKNEAPEPQEEPEEEEAPPRRGRKAAPAEDSGASNTRLDALGKALDDAQTQLTAKMDELQEDLYVLIGISSDIYLGMGSNAEELGERIEELRTEWNTPGN